MWGGVGGGVPRGRTEMRRTDGFERTSRERERQTEKRIARR